MNSDVKAFSVSSSTATALRIASRISDQPLECSSGSDPVPICQCSFKNTPVPRILALLPSRPCVAVSVNISVGLIRANPTSALLEPSIKLKMCPKCCTLWTHQGYHRPHKAAKSFISHLGKDSHFTSTSSDIWYSLALKACMTVIGVSLRSQEYAT